MSLAEKRSSLILITMGVLSVEENIVILCVFMVLLTGSAVFLRFAVRKKQKLFFGADDWWVLGGLVTFYMASGFIIWCRYCSLQLYNLHVSIFN